MCPCRIQYHLPRNEPIGSLAGNRNFRLPCEPHPTRNQLIPLLQCSDLWPNCCLQNLNFKFFFNIQKRKRFIFESYQTYRRLIGQTRNYLDLKERRFWLSLSKKVKSNDFWQTWSKELAIWWLPDRIHGTWLQVNQDCPWHISSTICLGEIYVDAFHLQIISAMKMASLVNTMLVGDEFPKLKCT